MRLTSLVLMLTSAGAATAQGAARIADSTEYPATGVEWRLYTSPGAYCDWGDRIRLRARLFVSAPLPRDVTTAAGQSLTLSYGSIVENRSAWPAYEAFCSGFDEMWIDIHVGAGQRVRPGDAPDLGGVVVRRRDGDLSPLILYDQEAWTRMKATAGACRRADGDDRCVGTR